MQAACLITSVKTTAERLKHARKARGLTQAQLAKRAHVSQSTIGNLESGTRNKPRELMSIASALEVPPEWLESGKNPPNLDQNHLHKGADNGFVLDESTVNPFKQPPRLEWEHLLIDADLPPVFELAMPDDSMEPFTPRGTVLVLTCATLPVPGHGVLVCNARGEHFIRMYQQGPSGRWIAQPRNPAYAALDSERDELRVLATVTGRMSGVM